MVIEKSIMPLEDEIEDKLKKLHTLNVEYDYHKGRIKGKSGIEWNTDFVLTKQGSLHGIIECKDVGGREWEKKTKYPTATFETHMCRAYARLNDLHLEYPRIRLYVIVREFLESEKQQDKYIRLLMPIGAELMCLKMIREDPAYYLFESEWVLTNRHSSSTEK
jgi:hypothetical protein